VQNRSKFFYGYVIVAVAFFVIVLMSGTLYTFGVFLKPLAEELGASRAVVSGAHSLCVFMVGAFFILTGRLTDRFGPRLVLSVCGVIVGSGYIMMSQLTSVWQLYFYYGLVVPLGMSGGIIPLTSTVSKWFVKRRGLMVGIALSGAGAGTVIMPMATTQLISSYDWRTAYIVVGIIAMVLITLMAQLLRRDPSRQGVEPYGSREQVRHDTLSTAAPYTFKKATSTAAFWILSAAYFVYGVFTQATIVHVVPNATDAGISALAATGVLTVIGATTFAGRIILGATGDKIGYKQGMVISFVLGLIAFTWLHWARDLSAFYVFAVIFGLAYGGLLSMEAPTVAAIFGLKAHGAILGMVHFLGVACGGAVGPVLAGKIFDYSGSYNLAFLICIICAAAGIILTAALRPPSRAVAPSMVGESQ
jgi:MFS family permease